MYTQESLEEMLKQGSEKFSSDEDVFSNLLRLNGSNRTVWASELHSDASNHRKVLFRAFAG